MTKTLRIGYLPLLDAGLLLVAAAKIFDAEEGVKFELHREPSWANLRDKLAFGLYDAAQMLAPAVIASNLGLDGFPTPMIGVAALGLDGNGVSASAPLAEKICGGPAASARALATLAVETKPRFAHVFPYSLHHYQLLLWLRAGGVPLDTLSLTVTPPPLVGAALAAGFLDGFCVGAPWNELAQKGGAARLLFPCSALVRDCPEKVLAFTRENALREPGLAQAAARALRRAAIWGEHPENHEEFCALVGQTLDAPVAPEMVAQALARDNAPPVLRLDARATALSSDQALWVLLLMALAGQTEVDDETISRARAAFQPFGEAPDLPLAPQFFTGRFTPENWREILAILIAGAV